MYICHSISHEISNKTLEETRVNRFCLISFCPSRQEIDQSKREVFCCTLFSGSSFEIVSLNTRRLQRSSIFYTYIFTIAHDITQYLHIETEREKENKNKDLHHFNPPPFCMWFSHARRSNPPSFVIYQPHWPHWCSTGCGQGSELLKWERVIFRFGIVISSSLF